MARPTKVGLDYFSVDTDIFNDEKIEFVSAKYGLPGEAIALRLLSKIYRNGYFINWDDDALILFASKLKSPGIEDINKFVQDVLAELLKRDFFDKHLFDNYTVLTSRGIQRRYIKVCEDSKRKNFKIDDRFNLLGENPHKLGIIPEETQLTPEETPIIPGFSTQSTVQERIEKKRKVEVEERKENDSGNSPTAATVPVNSEIEKEEMKYIPNFEDITEIRLSIRRLFKRFAKKEKLDLAADLEPVTQFIFDNRKEMTRTICWKVIVQSFVILYQAERTDTGYLLGIIRKKIEEKHSEILKNNSKKGNNKSFAESIEDQKRQEEEDKIYVEKTMKEYREFYESTHKNPGFYTIDEEKKIEEAFLKNSFLRVSFYLEPKIESVSLSD